MSAFISFNFDMTDCSTSCSIYISFHPKGVLLGCNNNNNNNNNNDDDDDDDDDDNNNNTFI